MGGIRRGRAPSAQLVAAIVELEVGLRLERDEEAEREVAVRRLGERERGPPVVQVALQADERVRQLQEQVNSLQAEVRELREAVNDVQQLRTMVDELRQQLKDAESP